MILEIEIHSVEMRNSVFLTKNLPADMVIAPHAGDVLAFDGYQEIVKHTRYILVGVSSCAVVVCETRNVPSKDFEHTLREYNMRGWRVPR